MQNTLLVILSSLFFIQQAHSKHPPTDPGQLNKSPILEKNADPANTTLVDTKNNSMVSIFDHKHSAWTKILKSYVNKKGAVSTFNYKGLKNKPASFDKYLKELSAVSSKELNTWNGNQQIAFYINAYNAFTVKLIIDNYPVKSIKKIGGFFSSPWKKEFFTLLGKKHNLDWIEHEVLRKKYKEPRIHFAVNCASIGCPALRNEAFVHDQLDAQLEEQTKEFLQDSQRNYIKGNAVNLSKIFDWFEDDFKKSKGSVQAYVAPYITKDKGIQGKLKSKKYKVKYTNYDWNLNE